MFGNEPRVHLEQIALVVADGELPRTVAGAQLLRLSDLLTTVLETLCAFEMAEAVVPEQWPLLRTLQFVAAYRGRLAPLRSSPTAMTPSTQAP